MRSLLFIILYIFCTCFISIGQNLTISGILVDVDGNPISFANVLLYEEEKEIPVKGFSTTEDGKFSFNQLETGKFILNISYLGCKDFSQPITLLKDYDFGTITLQPATEKLNETSIIVRKPSIRKTAGKLVFNVENTSLSTGNTYELLKRTPGVLVMGDQISVKNRPTTIYINGQRTYLSRSEIITFFQNVDAGIIKSIEVITEPSAKYDAEAGTALNIITSKAIAAGYKGNISATYEQAIFPKYQFGTSHFYKNNWLNIYGSYSFSPRKENKNDLNFIRFFEPDGSTNSIWTGDFTRVTESRAHQANAFADITISPKSTLSLSTNILLVPNRTFGNYQETEFFNPQLVLDSIQKTKSNLESDKHNLSFNGVYELKLNEKGSKLSIQSNYINYKNDQFQNLASNYFLPNNTFLQNISFFTNSFQDSNLFTSNIDLENNMFGGTLQTGLKYSNIYTKTGLSYFDTQDNGVNKIEALSDNFTYKELIYAGYFNFEKSWEKWSLTAGLRVEQTDIEGISNSLGEINTQHYFKLFPTTLISYQANDNNGFGLAYKRSLQRPRFESLNPFRYFINENNFSVGNPNLLPAFDNKVTASYNYANKFFVELIYQQQENALNILLFQNNETKTLRQVNSNLEDFKQYSLDMMYASSITNWLYVSFLTSTFYMENEFLAVESPELTAKNSTYGFYGELYTGFTISKEKSISADLTTLYYSNLIIGSTSLKNLLNTSLSFRKALWNDRASLSLGVDDVFNTYNVNISSKYLNQDNSFFPMTESQLFRIGFKYNFGNFRLRDNKKSTTTDEGERLGS